MNITTWRSKSAKVALIAFILPLSATLPQSSAWAQTITAPAAAAPETRSVLSAKQIHATAIEVLFSDQQRLTLDFYGENIIRLFEDHQGGLIRDPEAKPAAQILVNQPRKTVSGLTLQDEGGKIVITTSKVKVQIDKRSTLMQIFNQKTQTLALAQAKPIQFDKKKVTMSFKAQPEEYFYGGGVQNGRFSHQGKVIAIENQNSWTDGGVASPTPYYWSTGGYGMMWHTFKKGSYDFGAKEKGLVNISHDTNYLDVFLMINEQPVALLNDFYQLTGHPVLLPKFGFFQGHLNAYNRDYWKESKEGMLFEDGKRYKESQTDAGGIKESLNGEKNNYQFSARAVIDRYKKHDMPLGWLLPNDGYGAGYGQTETLDGNIQNLKKLGDYARKNGVEIGLWTQSDLHPKAGVSALLQRDIVKEVKEAGVRVLKTDVAWVGAGYSFGLNGVADVAKVMTEQGNNDRPFIISLDGWAGTQRYAGIWSGDQSGAVWEYIRFHIPTYIGSGLSGQPNITSDTDGIFGGKNPTINTRDFQWKTFSPMELNMDGWGSSEKYPQAMGEPYTSINRHYLKLKAELMPYTYSIAREAVDGMPMIRAMFLENPSRYTHGIATQYQYLYGPSLLIAPIYQATRADEKGNDIRNGIYLPEGVWIDYFTGEKYTGNRILNSYDAPIWKLPVFVKSGAIIPMTNPANNVSEIRKDLRIYEFYPEGKTSFTEYDDDGKTEAYRQGKGLRTLITSELDKKARLNINIHPAAGDFEGLSPVKVTELVINLSEKPGKLTVRNGNKKVKISAVNSLEEFQKKENVYYYGASPNLNRFSTPGSEFEKVSLVKNPQLRIRLAGTDIRRSGIKVAVSGFKFSPADQQRVTSGTLGVATHARVLEENTKAYTLQPSWSPVAQADYYEIEFDDMLYTGIRDTTLLFDGLSAETHYTFKLRAVNLDGHGDWTTIKALTKSNPLEFAIQGITATSTAKDQEGSDLAKLFDFDESNSWHTRWGLNALPFELLVDLNTVNQLDKFHYLPRTDGGNGILLKGEVFYSSNKESWTSAGAFQWKRDGEIKVFNFENHPTARYLKIAVKEAVGGFGSGRELYVFKVPGTESYLPGDINADKVIDKNDLTSYTNYTGLRKGDADFDGYISNGDINKNNLIDAYDISVVATQLEGRITQVKTQPLSGKIQLSTEKTTYKKDELIEIKVSGTGLSAVNALSFALPYSTEDYEFAGVAPVRMKEMQNLTYDRLHTNGTKALYPTFVNIGEQETLQGNQTLFILKFKAKRPLKFNLALKDGLLVDQQLRSIKF